MKKLFLFITIFTAAVHAYAQHIYDANAQARVVTPFTSIQVSNAFDVYISQGNEEGLAVSSTDSKNIADIISQVENGVLKLSYKGGYMNYSNKKLKAYVSVKNLSRIDASNSTDIHILGTLTTDDLKITLSGASDMSGTIAVHNLTLNLSGASDAKLKGTVEYAKIVSSGASDIKSFDLSMNYCSLQMSGAADARITVRKELDVTVSGASSVWYKGEAKVTNSKISGASDVKYVGS